MTTSDQTNYSELPEGYCGDCQAADSNARCTCYDDDLPEATIDDKIQEFEVALKDADLHPDDRASFRHELSLLRIQKKGTWTGLEK